MARNPEGYDREYMRVWRIRKRYGLDTMAEAWEIYRMSAPPPPDPSKVRKKAEQKKVDDVIANYVHDPEAVVKMCLECPDAECAMDKNRKCAYLRALGVKNTNGVVSENVIKEALI